MLPEPFPSHNYRYSMCGSANNASEYRSGGGGGDGKIFDQVVADNSFIECVYYIVRLYKQKSLW